MHTEFLVAGPFEAGYVEEGYLVILGVEGPGGVNAATLIPSNGSRRSMDFDFAPGPVGFGINVGHTTGGFRLEAGPDEVVAFFSR
jgi:hypothetical protein